MPETKHPIVTAIEAMVESGFTGTVVVRADLRRGRVGTWRVAPTSAVNAAGKPMVWTPSTAKSAVTIFARARTA